MSGLSPYAVSQLLPASLGGPAPARPAALYLGLLTALVDRSATGVGLPEPAFPGYARPAVPWSAWGPVDGAFITNAASVPLPTPPSGQMQIVAAALCDDAAAGNVWWFLDTFAFVLDSANTSPALPPGLFVVGLPWMG